MLTIPNRGIMERVFLIRIGMRDYASSFAYSINGNHYLITAAHALQDMEHGVKGEILIFKDNNWLSVDATPYYYAGRPFKKVNKDIDLAILKIKDALIIRDIEIVLSSKGMYAGQEAYFLGFPFFKFSGEIGNGIEYLCQENNNGYPIPSIKNACVQYFNGSPKIYLAGLNNEGFSGGPVIYWNYDQGRHNVLGFISSYLKQETGEMEQETSSNRDKFHAENSGIAVAYESELVASLIQKVSSIDKPIAVQAE